MGAARTSGLPFAGVAAWVALAVALCAPAAVQAQAATEAKRPKICLVLSGGGARGAAHVGVLKVLEELRIPVDCITGTSMGSIVGAAYASGIPVSEMEALLGTLSTRLLFKDLPPREERAMRLKRDDATILAPVEIGVRDGDFRLPRGLVSGVQLESVLRKLSRVQGFVRFDRLPIPFRAVATDLVTGKPVVLSEGELAVAMRASMSVPGVVEPVRLDGKMLVDGGLTNNLPVDVARAMGADVVIAVNLGTPLLRPEALNSVLGVSAQMVSILTEQNVQASLASLKPTDILVLPRLDDFSAADFDNLQETVPIGEASARLQADLLAKYALPPAAYAQWQHRREGAVAQAKVTPDEIRFSPLERVNADTARASLQTRAGDPIDQETLDRDMQRLYGTGNFEHVSYQLLEEPGRRILNVDAVEKSWGPNYLRAGLGLSSDFKGDAFFNLLASYRKTWLNHLGAEWRNDVQVGQTNRLYTEFYQPLEMRQRYFIVPSAEYERRTIDLFSRDQRIARFDAKVARLNLETGLQSRYGELRLGVSRAEVRTELDTGPPEFDDRTETGFTAVTLRGLADQFDNLNFPRAGYGLSVEVLAARTGLGSDVNFTRAEASGSYVKSFGDHTFSASFKLGRALGGDPLPAIGQFQWGGMLQQSGYPTGALVGEDLRFGRLVYYNRLHRWSLLEGIYGGGSLEIGQMNKPIIAGNETGTLKSFALLLGVDTPIGPLYLSWGKANHGYTSWYLFLGRP